MTPSQAKKLSRYVAMRVQLANGDYAVTQRGGKWHAVSPRSGLALAPGYETPQQALATAVSRGFKLL